MTRGGVKLRIFGFLCLCLAENCFTLARLPVLDEILVSVKNIEELVRESSRPSLYLTSSIGHNGIVRELLALHDDHSNVDRSDRENSNHRSQNIRDPFWIPSKLPNSINVHANANQMFHIHDGDDDDEDDDDDDNSLKPLPRRYMRTLKNFRSNDNAESNDNDNENHNVNSNFNVDAKDSIDRKRRTKLPSLAAKMMYGSDVRRNLLGNRGVKMSNRNINENKNVNLNINAPKKRRRYTSLGKEIIRYK